MTENAAVNAAVETTTVHADASAEYRAVRTELLAAERDLRDATAKVAALRAALPPGPAIPGSLPLTTATGKPTTLAGLLGKHDSLLVYHLMYDAGWTEPCAMCAMWIDGIDAQVPHLTERTAVAVLSPAAPGRLAELAARRAWRWIPVVSTQPGDLTDRLGVRTADSLLPAVTVLARQPDGTLRVHWHGTAGLHEPAEATGPGYDPGDGTDGRGLDPFCVTWALLDLLPRGRGDWYASRTDRVTTGTVA